MVRSVTNIHSQYNKTRNTDPNPVRTQKNNLFKIDQSDFDLG